jgi:sirohydrochlorin cobaltochelatase
MEQVAARLLALQPALLVTCAYLELDQPDLPTAAADLIAQGAGQLTVLPMFLGAGRHAREDLPLLVESLRRSYPNVAFRLRPPVGEDPRLLDLLAGMALE